jgi:hypothetical protein
VLKSRETVILSKMARVTLTEKVTFEKSLAGGEEMSHLAI